MGVSFLYIVDKIYTWEKYYTISPVSNTSRVVRERTIVILNGRCYLLVFSESSRLKRKYKEN